MLVAPDPPLFAAFPIAVATYVHDATQLAVSPLRWRPPVAAAGRRATVPPHASTNVAPISGQKGIGAPAGDHSVVPGGQMSLVEPEARRQVLSSTIGICCHACSR
jgi:hypothetical protein